MAWRKNNIPLLFALGFAWWVLGCGTEGSGDTEGVVEGDASISVDVTDQSAWSVAGNFQVFLESPTEQAVIRLGESVSVSGSVSHPSQLLPTIPVVLVSSSIGILAELEPSPSGTFSWSWESPPAGEETLTVQAVDNNGAMAIRSLVIAINTPPPKPTLAIEAILGGEEGGEVAPFGNLPQTSHDLVVDLAVLAETPADVDDDLVTYTFAWEKNGNEQFFGEVVQSELTERGNLWTLRGVADDGKHLSEETSVTVEIANTPPSLDSALIEVQGVGVLALYLCAPFGWYDPDLDPENYTVAWYRQMPNGNTDFLSGNTQLSEEGLRKGDAIYCTLTPFDETSQGDTIQSSSVTIENTKPSIGSLVISPDQGAIDTLLTCSYSGLSDEDPDDGSDLTVFMGWQVNAKSGETYELLDGVVSISTTAEQLGGIKGDFIRCVAYAFDGREESDPVFTLEQVVKNAKPVAENVAVVASLNGPLEGGELSCVFSGVSDPDDDLVSTIVSWVVNNHDALDGGAKVTGNPLTSDYFDKGDTVRCALLLDDGTQFDEVVSEEGILIENTPPSLVEAQVTPSAPSRNDTVKCLGLGWSDVDPRDAQSVWAVPDPDDIDTPSNQVRWYANGEIVEGANSAVWMPSSLVPGTLLSCVVTPFDGQEEGEPVAAPAVEIVNEVPSVAAALLTPEAAYANSTMTCTPMELEDPDGDGVTAIFGWTKNGITVAGETGETLGATVEVGDAIACSVTPYDGYAIGVSEVSQEVVVGYQPPSLSGVYIEVTETETGPTYECVVESVLDADGSEDVDISYEWYEAGGDLVAGSSSESSLSGYSFGGAGEFYCVATPSDTVFVGISSASSLVSVPEFGPTFTLVALEPENPSRESGATCVTETLPVLVPNAITYEWYQDGSKLLGEDTDTISGLLLEKGAGLSCVASVLWGDGESVYKASPSTLVVNTAPSTPLLVLSPPLPGPETELVCTASAIGADLDDDPLELNVQWAVGGNVVAEPGPVLSAEEVSSCAIVTCFGTFTDTESASSPIGQSSLVVGSDTVLELNGSGSALLGGSLPLLPGIQGDLTVELWVFQDEPGEAVFLEASTGYNVSDLGFALWSTVGQNPAFVMMAPGQGQLVVEGVLGTVPVGEWSHVAASYNGTTARVWLDGDLVGQANGSLEFTSAIELRLGASAYVSNVEFSGQMDNVRISSVDRYQNELFVPEESWLADADTVTLLTFDGGAGQSWLDVLTGLEVLVDAADGSFVGLPCPP